MKKAIIIFLYILFISNSAISQKNIYEAYMGKKVNWTDYVSKNILSRNVNCSTGELSVIPFNQSDEYWANDVMQICNNNTYTLASSGCAVSCMAMLLDANNQRVNPSMLNTYLKNNNGYSPCAEIKWDIACNYGNSTVQYTGHSSFSLDKIRYCLNNNNPVIISVKENSHFVIITGYKNEGAEYKDFTILDPNGGKEKKLSVFADDCNNGGEILRLFSNVNAPCIIQNPPSHCFNCLFEPELGEIDEDCGGDCPPCNNSNYSLNLVNNDGINTEIVAINDVLVEPEIGIINFTHKNVIKCSNKIILKNNTKISYGSEVSLKITDNRNELTRDCSDPCIFVPNVCFQSEYYIRTTNINYLDFYLFDRWSQIVREFHDNINNDGANLLFSSPQVQGVYFYVSEFTACDGDKIPYQGSIEFFTTKSDIYFNNNSKIYLNVKINKENLFVFPNPTGGNFTLSSPTEIKSVYIYDAIGEMVVVKNKIDKNTVSFNIDKQKKGLYYLKVFAGQKVKTLKIVKF